MANEKKPVERKIVKASTGEDVKGGAAPSGNALGLRIGALVLWLIAIAVEVVVILLINGILYLPIDPLISIIIGIAIILILVVIGAFFWKKANKIDPASEKNKVKFYLWNNMGVIAAVLAFFPLVLVLLKDKNLNQTTKKIASVVAILALVVASVAAIDFNPVSAEDLEAQREAAVLNNDGVAYWTQWGKSYHFDPDCHTLSRSSILYEGTIDEAFAAHREDPCDFCAGGADQKIE